MSGTRLNGQYRPPDMSRYREFSGTRLLSVWNPPSGVGTAGGFHSPAGDSWGAAGSPAFARGEGKPAITFGGADYFSASCAYLPTTGFTVAVRVLIPGSTPSNASFVSNADILDTDAFHLGTQGTTYSFRVGSIFSTGGKVEVTDSIYDGKWTTIVGVAYPDRLEFWFNGVLRNTNNTAYTRSAGGTAYIGAAPTTGWYFSGTIGGAMLFYGTLTGRHIWDLSNDFWTNFRRPSRAMFAAPAAASSTTFRRTSFLRAGSRGVF